MMESFFAQLLSGIQHNFLYIFALFFIGAYPLFGGIVWTTTSILFWFRRERHPLVFTGEYVPKVSVIISAYNEIKCIRLVLEQLCALDYPDYELIFIDDCSTDQTLSVLQEYAQAGKIRLISKNVNQGKAMAINDAMLCANGEIFFVMDCDSIPNPDILKHMVPHFQKPRVAVVAGNPRVSNTKNFLTRMQLVEYSAIIGMIRRSQRVWGRIMAFSGVTFAVRKTALLDVGGFSPAAATEDIDLTWKLQRKFWDVVYEPEAVVWTIVPSTYHAFFRQRIRWSNGLMYVLHHNYDFMFHWKYRRMWPVYLENVFTTIWVICLIIMSIIWLLSLYFKFPVVLGTSLVPAAWGAVLSTLTLILCLEGFLLDHKYDPKIMHFFPYSVFYPLYYWILLAVIAIIALPNLFRQSKKNIHLGH